MQKLNAESNDVIEELLERLKQLESENAVLRAILKEQQKPTADPSNVEGGEIKND